MIMPHGMVIHQQVALRRMKGTRRQYLSGHLIGDGEAVDVGLKAQIAQQAAREQ